MVYCQWPIYKWPIYMKEKVTPCLHGITMLRWEKWWYWCDRSRVPQFSWMQHNTACMWQWKQNHTENSGPSAREPQRQWSQLLGCISDHPNIFNSVHKSYTPTLSPGSRSDENATLEYAKKMLILCKSWRKEICWVSLVGKSLSVQ